MINTKTDNNTEPVPVSRGQRKKQHQRRRIYQVALALFERNGFDEVSVEAITEKADVAKGTFFNYFPSKTDVLVMFWAETLDDILSYGESLRALSSREFFHRYFAYFSRRVRNNATMFDILIHKVGQMPLLRHVDKRAAEREGSLYEKFLKTERCLVEIEQEHNADLISEMIVDLWVGTLRNWVFTGHKFSLERRLEKKLDILWSAIE